MAGRTSAEREALDAQAKRIMTVFTRAGFDFIAPDIVQPADMFLDSSGESIRARTYVFTDPAGRELCLRPDLTVPTCRYHLSHAADVATEARYCYSGPAFRHRANGMAEFDQAGIEWFNAADPVAAEAETLALAVRALEAVGMKQFHIRTGDLGLFHALLASIDMPDRWRRRLLHRFWRPQAFRDLLDLLSGTTTRGRTSISGHVDALGGVDLAGAVAYVEQTLGERELSLSGGRTARDIAVRLLEKAQDRTERPLGPEPRRRIDEYLAVEGSLASVPAALAPLTLSPAFSAAADRFARRTREMRRRRLAPEAMHFSADFGRSLEYYTGFVFEIEVEVDGEPLQIAGGGRYDSLMSDIGAAVPVPAVGCAIHTERLLAAMRGAR
jgi:ATP phosphoribosyltransferase regulatory subunit